MACLRVGPLPRWLGRRCPAALQDECQSACRARVVHGGEEAAHLLDTYQSLGRCVCDVAVSLTRVRRRALHVARMGELIGPTGQEEVHAATAIYCRGQ